MKKINIYGFIAAILLAASGSYPAAAQSRVKGGPEGSYTKTCKDIYTVDNITITAVCEMKAEPPPFSVGVKPIKDTSLNYIFTCKKPAQGGDIKNLDGTLCCERSLDTDEFRRARTVFDRVSAEVGGGVVFNNPDPDVEIQWWMAQYYKRAPAITSKLPSLGYDQVVGTVVRDTSRRLLTSRPQSSIRLTKPFSIVRPPLTS